MIKVNVLEDKIVNVKVVGQGFQTPPIPYQGSYEITPSESEQILQTKDKQMSENLVIHKIPSNYGKIAWNGVTLSVT